jgi:hypothetical protein
MTSDKKEEQLKMPLIQ